VKHSQKTERLLRFQLRSLVRVVACSASLIWLSACAASRPLIPPGEVPSAAYVTPADEAYGLEVLRQLSQQYPIVQNDAEVNRVRDLVDRLARAANAASSPWNVYVLQGDSVVNAAATRGNFVFVWTGMLHTAYTDAELATVLAHELGHVLANHTKATPEEEANQIIANMSGEIASSIVATQGQYGALAQVAGLLVKETVKALVVNPESQRQELEADQIGMFLMADAGFDPNQALSFWVRFGGQYGSSVDGPQFFSTHPATDERIEALEELLPAAEERYKQTRKGSSSGRKSGGSARASGRNAKPNLANAWVVTEQTTALRQSPDDNSPLIQELQHGDRVVVGAKQGQWVEVSIPSKGYVRARDIAPPNAGQQSP